jgi:hypothetical protein
VREVTEPVLVVNAAWQAEDFEDIFSEVRRLRGGYAVATELFGYTYESMFDNVTFCPCAVIMVGDEDDTVIRLSTRTTRAAAEIFKLEAAGFVWAATMFIPDSNDYMEAR